MEIKGIMKGCAAALALVITLAFAGGAAAAAETDTMDLGDVIVTATKSAKEIKNVAASVDVITSEEIESSSANSIDELIGNYAGVYAEREQDFLERKGSLTLRGLSSDDGRTLILVDGMQLNNGDSGSANFNSIDMGNVERIEIVRGPGSTIYGSDAMGGVINIITKKPAKEWKGTVAAEAGKFNTYKEKLTYSGSTGLMDLYLSASTMRSGGFNQAMPEDQSPGAYDTYTAEDHYFLKGVGHVGEADTTLSFTAALYDDERHEGQIEYPAINPEGSKLDYDAQRFQAAYSNPGGNYSANTSVFYNIENYDRVWDRSWGLKTVDSDRINYGLDSNATWKLGDHEMTVGAAYSIAEIDAVDDFYYNLNTSSYIPASSTDEDAFNQGQMDTMSFYIFDNAYLSDRLDAEIGIRYDDAEFSDGLYKISTLEANSGMSTATTRIPDNEWDQISPKIGFNYYNGVNSKLRVSYGKAFHAPLLEFLTLNMPRRFGTFISNPNLEPEEIDTYEIGVEHSGRRSSWALNYYYSDADNFIDYIDIGMDLDGDGRDDLRAMNIAQVEIEGIELSTSLDCSETSRLYFNTTWNSTKFKEIDDTDPGIQNLEGNFLADRPKWVGNLGFNYNRPDEESYSLNLRYVGSMYSNDDNDKDSQRDAYFTLNIAASKFIANDTELYMEVNNLFKPGYMETGSSREPLWQLPGEVWKLGVEYGF